MIISAWACHLLQLPQQGLRPTTSTTEECRKGTPHMYRCPNAGVWDYTHAEHVSRLGFAGALLHAPLSFWSRSGHMKLATASPFRHLWPAVSQTVQCAFK